MDDGLSRVDRTAVVGAAGFEQGSEEGIIIVAMKISIRNERCSGCRLCQLMCSAELFGEINPKRSALKVKGMFPSPGSYEVTVCDQCGECANVCPEECIGKKGDAFVIDYGRCTGCLVCVDACPKDAMNVDPATGKPIKCVLCGACIIYCPREAIYDEEGSVKFAGAEGESAA